MDDAFWTRNWQAMDAIYSDAASEDISPDAQTPLTSREKSLYVNGLWIQGRYEEGLSILQSIQQDFPESLRAYADMLLILGTERAGRKKEALGLGLAAWESPFPDNVRYYLAYALARITGDLGMKDESVFWYRRMYEAAPNNVRGIQALRPILDLGGASADEAAALLINSPGSAQALSVLSPDAGARLGSLVQYALGYKSYTEKQYAKAMTYFDLASGDIVYGEAARYYGAYSAYRLKKDDEAYRLWSDAALTGFDYPQRSVQRLQSLAERSKKSDIVKLLMKVAEARKDDYPDVAADALAAVIKIGDENEARAAERELFSTHQASVQAASLRWERGWAAWKEGKWKNAFDQWEAGYSPLARNPELASRLLYWQSRALEKLKSPVAAERKRNELIAQWPGEYYTFLVAPDGGIKNSPVPDNFVTSSDLTEWGFVTYARLEGAGITQGGVTSADIPALCRTSGLAIWEGDFTAGARTFAILQRVLTPEDLASSELLKLSYPRAFERDVTAAAGKTGVAPEIIWGVMRQESFYQSGVTSSVGAYGLMQLMPATAKEVSKKLAMSDDAYLRPADNILLGAHYLAGLFARFKEPPLSLAAYNAGGTPVSRWSKAPISDMAEWVEDIAYRETRGYVKSVLRNIQMYKTIYPDKKDGDGSKDGDGKND
ncbi:MAG: lytic transglycosylase domain-containing protein [Synergistaceae bacterium]|nr:lytic transglycosylase domain-containing protein [Synergistaceae bacterium]